MSNMLEPKVEDPKGSTAYGSKSKKVARAGKASSKS